MKQQIKRTKRKSMWEELSKIGSGPDYISLSPVQYESVKKYGWPDGLLGSNLRKTKEELAEVLENV